MKESGSELNEVACKTVNNSKPWRQDKDDASQSPTAWAIQEPFLYRVHGIFQQCSTLPTPVCFVFACWSINAATDSNIPQLKTVTCGDSRCTDAVILNLVRLLLYAVFNVNVLDPVTSPCNDANAQ